MVSSPNMVFYWSPYWTQVNVLWGSSKLMGKISRNGTSVNIQILSLPTMENLLRMKIYRVMESK